MATHALLVPGWGTAPARFDVLASTLRDRDIAASTWAYDATGSVHAIARRLAFRAPAGCDLHLVGHSLGGLVVAAAALGPLQDRVRSVTTVNAPWRGTWLGWTASGALAESLRWGADELDELRAALADHLREPAGPSWLVLGAAADLGVPPTSSVRTPAGTRLERRVLPVAGHTPLEHPTVVAAIATHVAGRADDRLSSGVTR